MKTSDESPVFFAKPAQFRTWLKKNHLKCDRQWVGFYRKDSGRPSITWPESVDEALCFGWIDGLRKGIDLNSYKIRFTPRRSTSVWSAINIRRMKELIEMNRVESAGLAAFDRRTEKKSGIYSYENRKLARLSPASERRFRSKVAAWTWFQSQPPGYRQTAVWWVISAKKAETKEKRLSTLIADCAARQRIGPLRTSKVSRT